MDLIKSKCYKIIMTGLNEFTLYELPSIKIDGNSEQIFYVNCHVSSGKPYELA
jgi:hypothetical protein